MREEVGSLLNAGLMLVVMVPPILFVWHLQKCSSADGAVCNFYLQKPALFVNAVEQPATFLQKRSNEHCVRKETGRNAAVCVDPLAVHVPGD